MRILQISPSFYPATIYGGPIQSLLDLCLALAEDGCDVRVLTTNAAGRVDVLPVATDADTVLHRNLRVRYCARAFPHSASASMLAQLPAAVAWADVIHVTGFYSFPTLPSLLVAKLKNKPVVLSPRGALDHWGSRRPRFKAAWRYAVQAVAPSRFVLHVTSSQESERARLSLPNVSRALVPNGVRVPEMTARAAAGSQFRLGCLGRLHPVKGLEAAIEACARIDLVVPNWSLNIGGSGDPSYTASLRHSAERLGLSSKIRFAGVIADKATFFANIDVLLVPSHTESFGMQVAEALAHGVPVIASTGTPWSGLESANCGFWVANTPVAFADAILRASRAPLGAMGSAGRRWVAAEFSWRAIAHQMRGLYSDLSTSSAGRHAA